MLDEIYSPAFKLNGTIREPIKFEPGLNVVLGDGLPENGIGKSSFLLAIDFAFGGNAYPTNSVTDEIGPHTVFWTMSFGNEKFSFGRETDNKGIIIKCKKSRNIGGREIYTPTDETISLDQYLSFLYDKLNMNFDERDYRILTSLFLRVYPKPCSQFVDKPLCAFKKEADEAGITRLEKVFNYYLPIKREKEAEAEAKAKSNALTNAEGQKIVARITEKDVERNLEKINEIDNELEKLGYQEIEAMDAQETDTTGQLASINEDIRNLKNRRFELYAKRKILNGSYTESIDEISEDLNRLKRFFGDSFAFEKVEKIQEFHIQIQNILKQESNEELKEIEDDISRINEEISSLEKKKLSLNKTVGVSPSYFDKAVDLRAEKVRLEEQNKTFSAREKIRESYANASEELKNIEKSYLLNLQNSINATLSEFIKEMFADRPSSRPTISFSLNKKCPSYTYHSYNDGSTGAPYRDLILLDLAIMKLTSLPVLIHDNNLTKTIEYYTVEKLFSIYEEVSKGKQVFVAFDGLSTFTDANMISEINRCTRLHLSKADNNYLYGKKFATEPPKRDEQMTLF